MTMKILSHSRWYLVAAGLLMGLVAVSIAADRPGPQRGDLTIEWWTVDGGGGMDTAGGAFTLSGTIGQLDAGDPVTMTGSTLSLTGGFWAGVAPAGPVLGDCDGDSDVDLDDFAILSPCLAGPDVGIAPSCACADLTGDSDADLEDFAAFQQVFAQ